MKKYIAYILVFLPALITSCRPLQKASSQVKEEIPFARGVYHDYDEKVYSLEWLCATQKKNYGDETGVANIRDEYCEWDNLVPDPRTKILTCEFRTNFLRNRKYWLPQLATQQGFEETRSNNRPALEGLILDCIKTPGHSCVAGNTANVVCDANRQSDPFVCDELQKLVFQEGYSVTPVTSEYFKGDTNDPEILQNSSFSELQRDRPEFGKDLLVQIEINKGPIIAGCEYAVDPEVNLRTEVLESARHVMLTEKTFLKCEIEHALERGIESCDQVAERISVGVKVKLEKNANARHYELQQFRIPTSNANLVSFQGQPPTVAAVLERMELIASDISILVPLKADPQQAQPYPPEGNGICHALPLTLNKGGAFLSADGDHIIKPETFLLMMKDIVYDSPMRASGKDPAHPDNSKIQSLVQGFEQSTSTADMQTLLTDLCLLRNMEGSLASYMDKPESDLLKSNLPATIMRRFPPEICRYDSWRIVATRWDPCANRAQLRGESVDKLRTSDCMTELRLIAQPVLCYRPRGSDRTSQNLEIADCRDPQALLRTMDHAMHLVYEIKEDDKKSQLASAFLRLASARKDHGFAFAEIQSASLGAEQFERVVLPHPGLGKELESCGNGPVGMAYYELLYSFAKEANLSGMTISLSDYGPNIWTFGKMNVSHNGNSTRITSNISRNDNYILKELTQNPSQRKLPFNFDHQSVFPGSNPKHNLAEVVSSQLQANSKILSGVETTALIETMNPHRTSQVLNSALMDGTEAPGTNCISCHLSQAFLTDFFGVAVLEAREGAGAYRNSSRSDSPVPLYRPYLFRSLINVRNFGYEVPLAPSVSLRTLNETDDLLSLIKIHNL